MKIKNFSDQDLYSWSVCLFYLLHFSEMSLSYDFIDRNNTVYPEGFAKRLMDEVKELNGLKMTEEEIENLKRITQWYFPSWFYVFMKGLELKSNEVEFHQSSDGKLHGKITGPAWRTVFWEQILLSTISEMYHSEKGEVLDSNELDHIQEKANFLADIGVSYVDMGTRRRFSREYHELILDALATKGGGFIGTSNLWLSGELQKKFPKKNLKCIGTMSHQVISVCAAIYGPREANRIAMDKWMETYRGNLGIYLPDCLGTNAFYKNVTSLDAKTWDGWRIDSGDNWGETEKILAMLKKFSIPEKAKKIVFSNGLSLADAYLLDVKVRSECDLDPSFGIGTSITCGMANPSYKPLNIVIKAVSCQLTSSTEWLDCVKLSCDISKATGNQETVQAYKTILGIK